VRGLRRGAVVLVFVSAQAHCSLGLRAPDARPIARRVELTISDTAREAELDERYTLRTGNQAARSSRPVARVWRR